MCHFVVALCVFCPFLSFSFRSHPDAMDLVLQLSAAYEGQPLPAELQDVVDRVLKAERLKLKGNKQGRANAGYAALSASKNGM